MKKSPCTNDPLPGAESGNLGFGILRASSEFLSVPELYRMSYRTTFTRHVGLIPPAPPLYGQPDRKK